MTISVTSTYSRASGNGVTTVFNFPMAVFANTDLVVSDIIDATGVPTVKTLTTDYSVSISATAEGGSVTFVTAPSSGHTVDIRSLVPLTQPVDIRNQGRFLPEIHEGEFDRLDRQIQDTRRILSNAPQIPDNEIPPDWSTILSLANRKGKYGIFFNATTGAPELYASIGATTLSQSIIGGFFYPQILAETNAGATPVNFYKYYCDPERYTTNASPGTTDMTAALGFASAASALGGGNVVVASLIRVTANTTLAAGATLTFAQGGQITVDVAKTLTLNCKVLATRSQFFSGSGSVLYGTYLGSREATAYPEWFGAVHDNSTDDTSAVQKAINMVAACFGIVSLSAGYYKVTSTLTLTTRGTIRGSHWIESVISWVPAANDDSLFENISSDSWVFEDFGVVASGAATGKRGFTLTSTASAYKWNRVSFSALNDWCISHDSAQHDFIEHCRFLSTHNATNSGVAILTSTFATHVSVNKNRFSSNDRDFKVNTLGAEISFCENSQESTGSLSGAPDCSVELNNVVGFRIASNYCEAVRTNAIKGVFEIIACQGGEIVSNYMVSDQGGVSYSARFVNCSGNTRYVSVNNNYFKEANVGAPVLVFFINAGNFVVEAHNNSYTRNGVAQTTYQAAVVYLGTPANLDINLPFTFAYDPPNLAAGTQTTNNTAMTGLVFGDRITVVPPYDLQGIQQTAYVQSAGNFTTLLRNGTAAPIDLANNTWTAYRQAGNL